MRALLLVVGLLLAAAAGAADQVVVLTSQFWQPSAGAALMNFDSTADRCLVVRTMLGSASPPTVRLFVGSTEIAASTAITHSSGGQIVPFYADETLLSGITGSQTIQAYGSAGIGDTLVGTVRAFATLYDVAAECTPPTASTNSQYPGVGSTTTVVTAAATVPAGGILDVGVLSWEQPGTCSFSDSMVELYDKFVGGPGSGNRGCVAYLATATELASKQITATMSLAQARILSHAVVISPQEPGEQTLEASPTSISWDDGATTLTATPMFDSTATVVTFDSGDTVSLTGASNSGGVLTLAKTLFRPSAALENTPYGAHQVTITDGADESAEATLTITAASAGSDHIITVACGGGCNADVFGPDAVTGDTAQCRLASGSATISAAGVLSDKVGNINSTCYIWDVSGTAWIYGANYIESTDDTFQNCIAHAGLAPGGPQTCGTNIMATTPSSVTTTSFVVGGTIPEADRRTGKAYAQVFACADASCSERPPAFEYTDGTRSWREIRFGTDDEATYFNADVTGETFSIPITGRSPDTNYRVLIMHTPDQLRPRNKVLAVTQKTATSGGDGDPNLNVSWNPGHYGSYSSMTPPPNVNTTLDGAASGTTIPVTTTTGFVTGKAVALRLDSGLWHMTTVDSINAGVSVILDDAVPSAASSGNPIRGYTIVNTVSSPFRSGVHYIGINEYLEGEICNADGHAAYTGIKVRQHWGDFEGQKGVYDFHSSDDWLYAAENSCHTGGHRVFFVAKVDDAEATFYRRADDPVGDPNRLHGAGACAPDWVWNKGAVTTYDPAPPKVRTCTAEWWLDAEVRDGMLNFLAAFANHYNGEPLVEAISMTGEGSNPNGTNQQWAALFLDWMRVAEEFAPNKLKGIGINHLNNKVNTSADGYDYAEWLTGTPGTFLASPDAFSRLNKNWPPIADHEWAIGLSGVVGRSSDRQASADKNGELPNAPTAGNPKWEWHDDVTTASDVLEHVWNACCKPTLPQLNNSGTLSGTPTALGDLGMRETHPAWAQGTEGADSDTAIRVTPQDRIDKLEEKSSGVYSTTCPTSVTGKKFRRFTSAGTGQIAVGNTIVGATSGATAVVRFVLLNRDNSWNGDGEGFFRADTQTGTFEAEDLNIQGGASDVATINGNLQDLVCETGET